MLFGFIIGIVIVVIVLPIIDYIMETIRLTFEIVKNKLSIIVVKQNNIIMDLQNELEPQNSQAIGFQVSSDDDYYDEDDDCDYGKDELVQKNKNKIGFT